jgi:RNA polymerase sigma-70 factor (ECF subfamily)
LWDELNPERVIGGRQLWAIVQEAIETLPAGQKAVIILRDMEDQSAEATCALLQISPENQRVLLHRARGRIRKAIDAVTGDGVPAATTATARRAAKPSGAVTRLAAVVLAWLYPPRKSRVALA